MYGSIGLQSWFPFGTKFHAGNLPRFQKELMDADLLILDELGFAPFHKDGYDHFSI